LFVLFKIARETAAAWKFNPGVREETPLKMQKTARLGLMG